MKIKVRQRALRAGYRSGLEQDTAKFLKDRGVKFTYEQFKIKWVDPKTKTYTPDFVLENGIIIETKGRFISPDRAKHLAVRDQYPDLDLRFVFTNSRTKLYKGRKRCTPKVSSRFVGRASRGRTGFCWTSVMSSCMCNRQRIASTTRSNAYGRTALSSNYRSL